MRTVYRVTVAAVNYDDEGNFVADETLFEATHHRAAALLRFAPTEVDDALRVAAGFTEQADEPEQVPTPAPVSPSPADGAAELPKRKRRTKAEIAADEAAALAAQQQTSAAPVEGGPAPQAPTAEGEPQPVGEPAPQPASAPASVTVTAPTPAVAYNPFA